MIKTGYAKAVEKIEEMSPRERVLSLLAGIFMVFTLINSLAIAPMQTRIKRQSLQLAEEQEKLKVSRVEYDAMLQAKKQDENSPARRHLQELKQRIADGEVFLQTSLDRMVPPDEIARLLEQVLVRNTQVQLVALKTLPAEPLIEPQAVAQGNSPAETVSPGQGGKIYKHGIELTLRGTYAELLDYLTDLEKLQAKVYWGGLVMNVTQHPTVELTLTLYTLSFDSVWMKV